MILFIVSYDIICHTPDIIIVAENKMQRQRVFFFAAKIEGSDTIADLEDLKKIAVNYVDLYGESCLNDPETPSFVSAA